MNMCPINTVTGRLTRETILRSLLPCAATLLIGACASTQGNGPYDQTESEKAADFNTSLGLEYMNRGQYEVALGKLKKAIREEPDYAPAHTVTAILYERIGEEDLAGKHYKKAYEADPDDGDVNNNYGTYLCKTGDRDEAIGHFMKALDDPFYSSPEVALTNAGSCVLGEGDLAEADEYLRAALRVNPKFPDALITMASLNYERQNYLKSRAFIQRYEEVAQHDPASLLLAYRVETAMGDQKSAADYRRALLNGFPESEQAADVRRTSSL